MPKTINGDIWYDKSCKSLFVNSGGKIINLSKI